MNHYFNSVVQRNVNRLLVTLAAICLPVIAATCISGSFFHTGTLKPGEVFNVAEAHAAVLGHAGAAPNVTVDVQMQRHDVFAPANVTIAVGDTVRWTNTDDEQHTTTSDTGVWNSGPLNSGQSFAFTFNAPGTYGYFCAFHSGMRGTIVVTGSGSTSTPAATTTQTITPGATTTEDRTTTPGATRTEDRTVTPGATMTEDRTVTPGTTMTEDRTVTPGATGTGTPDATTTPGQTQTPGGTATAGTTGTPQASTTPNGNVNVNIQNFAFQPQNLTVNVGTTVHWTNLDSAPHSATSDSGVWDSNYLFQGQSYQYTFNTAGTFTYHCSVHSGMQGAITVTSNSGSTRVTGHVVWQGRPAQPNSAQQMPITLTLKSGALEVNYPALTTDNNGFFTLDSGPMQYGSYQWRVKGPKYLANVGTATLSGNTLTIEMGLMRVGDANNDNIVNVVDFNIMKVTFGKGIGEPGYDDRADFTGDQAVNVSDFNLLKINFGQGGGNPTGPSTGNNN